MMTARMMQFLESLNHKISLPLYNSLSIVDNMHRDAWVSCITNTDSQFMVVCIPYAKITMSNVLMKNLIN